MSGRPRPNASRRPSGTAPWSFALRRTCSTPRQRRRSGFNGSCGRGRSRLARCCDLTSRSGVPPMEPMSRLVLPTLAISVLAAFVALSPTASAGASGRLGAPLVSVARHGGLCFVPSSGGGRECREELTITDREIRATGYRPRKLTAPERTRLRAAIAALDWTAIRRRPFRGTCPTAFDGQESVYRLRGFQHTLASCRYDLRTVRAVQLTEHLLAPLKPPRR